ncbi:HlyIII-domain-containing protein [Auriculariales sp. MPI-PUGE-AT-0066]|nr:HlyIII-domain-containing protein [Auriculariales sp. MPI-PUGE-AT-0066]
MSSRPTLASASTTALAGRGSAQPRARSRTPLLRRSSTSHHRPRRHSQSGSSYSSFRNTLSTDEGALPTLGSIRLLVLARLAEIEEMLSEVEMSDVSTPERVQVVDLGQMIHKLREEVLDRLPEISLDTSALEQLVAQHLPWTTADIRTQIEGLAHRLPEFSLSDMPAWAAGVADDWKRVVSTVQARLADLEHNVQSITATHTPSEFISELLERIASSDLFDEYRETEETKKMEQDMAIATEVEIAIALRHSCHGEQHITYDQLPHLWKNNDYVHAGYRFIPLSKWPKLLSSTFTLHNETCNIHTHFLPLVFSLYSCAVLGPSSGFTSTPDMLYTQFARLCLLTSAIWHIFSGCAHPGAMEFFARLDYVGIGWLISASIATLVYYGWSCHSFITYCYLGACLATAISGSFLPFMTWFNERKHKKWRLLYFLLLSITGFAPIVHLAFVKSAWTAFMLVAPIIPSHAMYLIGVAFYASHFPEVLYGSGSNRWAWADRLDSIGLNSHAIWHLCIIAAIWLHRWCLQQISGGFAGEVCQGILG